MLRVPGLPGTCFVGDAQGGRQGSSDPLEQAVMRGLAERGADVIDLGTPRHGKVDLRFHLAVDCGLWHETSGVRNRSAAIPASMKSSCSCRLMHWRKEGAVGGQARFWVEYVSHLLSYIESRRWRRQPCH